MRLAFMRLAGMVQTADLRSISSQVAPRTSPVRAAVRTVNSMASAAHGVALADLADEPGDLFVGQRRVVPLGNFRPLGQQLVQVPPPEGGIGAMPEPLGPGRIQHVLNPAPQA